MSLWKFFHIWKNVHSLTYDLDCCLHWQCAGMHSPPFPGIDKPSSTQRAMLTPHHHHRFHPTLPHLCCNSSMLLSTPSSQPTGLPSRQPNKLSSTQPTSSSYSLGVEDPSSAQGGIAPSIAVLVMRCKVLLSLSIQPVGGGLRWTLYCCTNHPPLSLLPGNIEACALLNASFRCAPTCYLFLPLPNVLPPRPCCNLFLPRPNNNLSLPNTSATAVPPPYSDAAMPLHFKCCSRSCNLLLLLHCGRLL